VTKLDAIILKMINDAGLGNAKMLAGLIALMGAAGLLRAAAEPAQQEALTADDQAVIADFFERNGDKAKSTERSEGPGPRKAETGKEAKS
jgi:hypothetical protein